MQPATQPRAKLRGTFGAGIYPAGEAARLAQLEPQRLRRWVEGYSYQIRAGERRSSKPVFKNEARRDGQHLVLSFLDLIEACFVKVFLDHGVSLQTIRVVADRGRKHLQDRAPVLREEVRD